MSAYHLLRHLLRHVFVELKEELDGVVVLVLPVELLGVVHAQPQLQARLHHVVLLRQLHMHAIVFLEEGVIQEVLNGVPAGTEEKSAFRCADQKPRSCIIYPELITQITLALYLHPAAGSDWADEQ